MKVSWWRLARRALAAWTVVALLAVFDFVSAGYEWSKPAALAALVVALLALLAIGRMPVWRRR